MQRIFTLTGEVQDVGLRIGLINSGMSKNVMVFPHNSETNRNRVDVIAVGNKQDILKFYDEVKKDLRIGKKGSKYTQTPLTDYKGKIPNWTWFTIQFILEQLKKGAFEYFEIRKLLEELVKKKRKTQGTR